MKKDILIDSLNKLKLFTWTWNLDDGYNTIENNFTLDKLTPMDYKELIRSFNLFLTKEISELDIIVSSNNQWYSVDITSVTEDENDNITSVFGVFKDITKQYKQIKFYKDIAFKDSLTGHFNRSGLDTVFNKFTKDTNGALLFIDLDNFKKLNDSYGHDIGDEMLKRVASSIYKTLPEHSHLARISGDEFVIFIHDIQKREELNTIANEILESIIKSNDESIMDDATLTGSIGVALFPYHSNDINKCINKADHAMYVAKKRGKAKVVLYDQKVHDEYYEYIKMHTTLLKAFKRNEFKVKYQPIYDMKLKKIEAFEIFPYWKHPKRGIIESDQFLHTLYEEGLILTYDEWMIEEAIKNIALLKEKGYDIKFTVNISPKHLGLDHFYTYVAKKLKEYDVEGKYLYIEMVEFILKENFEMINYNFKKLQELGVKIIIDGFGINQSTISVLKIMNFDMIKINKYFVETLNKEFSSEIILETIIKLAHQHNKEFIAEGVVDENQFKKVRNYDVTYAQGSYLSIPKPLDEIIKMIERATKI